MNDVQQRAAAKRFADFWKGKGYERGESQKFWISLLADVFGVEHAAEYITFEDQVHLDHTSFIDGYIPATHVLIEQKGLGKDLKKPIKQSDGTLLKPIQQAQRYASVLPYSQRPRWIIVCNFECFHVYDMEHPQNDPTEILLADLPSQYYLLEFLVQKQDLTLQKEMEISIQAGGLVGKLYDAFLKEYIDPTDEHSLKSLNALCVRLVFCLYAEDAGIFGKRLMFHDYMQHSGANKARQALIDLFRVLDTPIDKRDRYMDEELAAFPYVNGGLFSDENIEIPRLNETILDLLLNKASAAFDWSEISPTIFGAVFESTLNPETRRSGGMHYTSIENIHKVIDPLFLDDLKAELEEIKAIKVQRMQEQRLRAFQDKVASLTFLDPAAGSGNFLTESYLCLRRLENEVINLLQHGQVVIGAAIDPIKVSIAQFYGIEINDFAATVAKTALWIAESQMLKRTEDIVHLQLDFLPLKSYVNIIEGNALRLDWNEIVPKEKLSYIMGNPPFVGARMMAQGSKQKQDIQSLFPDLSKNDVQDLDYVTCWYKIAAEYIQGTHIECCFVSTNSICQGSQVPILWNVMLNQYGIRINYAYQTFRWNSESTNQAAVHCVIIGFATFDRNRKILFTNGKQYSVVPNISPYLTNGSDALIIPQKKPICDVPLMNFGNQPRDGGYFVIKEEEYNAILQAEPFLKKYLLEYIGAEEFINNKKRWCLWLKHVSPNDIKNSKILYQKIEAVKKFRLESRAKTTNGYAKVPHLFAQITQPEGVDYLLIPSVSSERRKYIPIGFMPANVIASNAVQIVPEAGLYEFGVLTSNVHMAWMRTVAGRLEMRYRYSAEIVYNTFPWAELTLTQKAKIEKTAQAILDARALYPDCSYAVLYDDISMPPELRKAHQQNDIAVMQAYGMPIKETTESSCVAELMRRYQALTAAENNP